MSDSDLRERFADLWVRLGGHGDVTPRLDSVLRSWQEPHRRYHGLDHLRDCLVRLDESPATGMERDLAEAALWYHDVIYRPGAPDNEARSAELARCDLPELGAAPEDVDEVARLILLTAGHQVAPGDRLGAVLICIDLSILAAPPADYDVYAQRVRAEYAHVPEALWRPGRTAVLQRFLAEPVIFPDPAYRTAHEAQARANMEREIASLA